jgi:perosamine synthetase
MALIEPKIPVAGPSIGARERELVEQVLASGVLALGPFAERFEGLLAEVAGRRHGIACSSGTAALHMIVRALGITDGDEVVTSPFSFVASANSVMFERARPVFVDIEEDRLGIDPERVEGAIGPRTKAIMPIEVFGRACRIDEVVAIADRHGLAVIEDACEALGSSIGTRPLGSFGVASAFAFYPNKQITTGEGGVVLTDDRQLAESVRSLRNQGRDTDGTWLRHVQLGYNYRLPELSAAVGVAQLERRAELAAGRARVVAAYAAAFRDRDWLRIPMAAEGETVDWFVYVVRFDERVDRARVIADLEASGVASRPYFAPLHLQPLYRSVYGFHDGDFPVTERIARTTLALPFSPVLSDEDVAYVADAVTRAVERQFAA